MKTALRDCVAWLREHNATLEISGHDEAEIIDEQGETLAYATGFSEAPARILCELVEEARAPRRKVESSAPPVLAQHEWFGFGETRFAWEEQKTIVLMPAREFAGHRMMLPSTLAGYLIMGAKAGGQAVFANAAGVPVELFSEVSTAPQIRWPVIGAGIPLELELRAPSCPPAPHPFIGAMYGTALETKK